MAQAQLLAAYRRITEAEGFDLGKHKALARAEALASADAAANAEGAASDDRPALLKRAIGAGATNPPGWSRIHGEDHWKSVAVLARWLGADPDFAITFAVLHDLMRDSDDLDPDHGRRAAELFLGFVREGLSGWPASADRTHRMAAALAGHADGEGSRRPDMARCWSADRLTLPRVGIEPSNALLSTPKARTSEAKLIGRVLASSDRLPVWPQIESTEDADELCDAALDVADWWRLYHGTGQKERTIRREGLRGTTLRRKVRLALRGAHHHQWGAVTELQRLGDTQRADDELDIRRVSVTHRWAVARGYATVAADFIGGTPIVVELLLPARRLSLGAENGEFIFPADITAEHIVAVHAAEPLRAPSWTEDLALGGTADDRSTLGLSFGWPDIPWPSHLPRDDAIKARRMLRGE